jgi:hypothetical protein
MTRWFILAGLIVLNGILGVGVFQRSMERRADAQIGGIGGPNLDVVTIAGVSNGQTVIYLLDANSGILLARRIDVANQRFDPPVRRDVATDLRKIP